MKIGQQNNTVLAAGLGAAIGAEIGHVVGAKKAAKTLSTKLKESGIEGLSADQYVNLIQNKNLEKLIGSDCSRKNVLNIMQEVTKKARADFANMTASAIKAAKNTKIKWIAGLAAAGLAIGVVVSKIASKKAESKEQ